MTTSAPAPVHPATLPLAAYRAAFEKEDRRRRYWRRPDLWAQDFVKWPRGACTLTPYHLETMRNFADVNRQAIRGPHGIGKTFEGALLVHWFALTRDEAGIDWKIPTLASAWRQLTKYLWPEIHKWALLLDWEKLGRGPYVEGVELLDLNLKLRCGEAFALASDNHTSLEGAHASQLFYLFDESKAIPAKTFDAAEGAFAQAGETETFALAISTPGEAMGRFYDICARKPGYEDWRHRFVRKAEAIAAGRMTAAWAAQRARQWGKDSAVFQNRVEGEFAVGSEAGVIPLAWVEAAIERWKVWKETRDLYGPVREEPLTSVGADFARGGGDESFLAPKAGPIVKELRHIHNGKDLMPVEGALAALLAAHLNAVGVLDVIGLGAGIFDHLREAGRNVRGFNAAAGCELCDRSGEFGFLNMRSAGWWHLRELLDPAYGAALALPPDDELIGDLTAPKWRVTSAGKIQVESKDDAFMDAEGNKGQSLRERLGRSTDKGDAVVMACADDLLTAAAGGNVVEYMRMIAAQQHQADGRGAGEKKRPLPWARPSTGGGGGGQLGQVYRQAVAFMAAPVKICTRCGHELGFEYVEVGRERFHAKCITERG